MVPEKQQNGNALINRYLSIRIVKLFKLKKNKQTKKTTTPFFKVDKPVKMLLLVEVSKIYSTHHTKCHWMLVEVLLTDPSSFCLLNRLNDLMFS